MPVDIDLFLGKRVRRRRRLLGLTQQRLSDAVGVRFQQIQKYECGANRISAARIWQLSKALQTPVSYFFEGLDEADGHSASGSLAGPDANLASQETADLIDAYYKLAERPRRRLLDLAVSMTGQNEAAV